jgi:hypothetical protein
MPMKPAAADRTAPIRKPKAVPHPRSFQKPITRNRTAATTAIVVYWRRRYAEAPSCTACAIACIRSVPAGRPSSQTVRPIPKAIATPEQTSAIRTGLSAKKSRAAASRKARRESPGAAVFYHTGAVA